MPWNLALEVSWIYWQVLKAKPQKFLLGDIAGCVMMVDFDPCCSLFDGL